MPPKPNQADADCQLDFAVNTLIEQWERLFETQTTIALGLLGRPVVNDDIGEHLSVEFTVSIRTRLGERKTNWGGSS
jgi:hypothetical protein